MGRGRVWVPSHLFKLVYDEASRRSWAYILANTAEAPVAAPVDYAEFVKQTGWQLLAARPTDPAIFVTVEVCNCLEVWAKSAHKPHEFNNALALPL